MNKKFVCMIVDEMAHTNNVWAMKSRLNYDWENMTYYYQCYEALFEMKKRLEKHEHIDNSLLLAEAIDCGIKVRMDRINNRKFTDYIQNCVNDGTFEHWNWDEE